MSVFWPAVIVLLVLGLGLYLASRSKPVPSDRADDDVPATVQRVRSNVRAILSKQYPAAMVSSRQTVATDPRSFAVLILLTTDREREELKRDRHFTEQFRQALVDADYPISARAHVGFEVDSRETVDRDFGGAWPHGRR